MARKNNDSGAGEPCRSSIRNGSDKGQHAASQPQDHNNPGQQLNTPAEDTDRELHGETSASGKDTSAAPPGQHPSHPPQEMIEGLKPNLRVPKTQRAAELGKGSSVPSQQAATRARISDHQDKPLTPGCTNLSPRPPRHGGQAKGSSILSRPRTSTSSQANVPARTATAAPKPKVHRNSKEKQDSPAKEQQPYSLSESSQSDSDTSNCVLCGTEQTARPEHRGCLHPSHRQ